MNIKFIILTATILSLAILSACGGSVSLINVWNDQEYRSGRIKNILVVGMAPRMQTRSIFEYQLTSEFNNRGIAAMSSLDRMPKDEEISKEAFEKYFKDLDIDAVLITGLLRADTTQSYVPGMSYSVSSGYDRYYDPHYRRDYWGYYHSRWTIHHEPGYMEETRKYLIESTLYETTQGRVIWRGVSEAVNPKDVMSVIDDLSKILVKRLGRDGIITLKK